MSQPRKNFDSSGCILFGKHRGSHWSKIPVAWLDWAYDNVQGFPADLRAAKDIPLREAPARAHGGRVWIFPNPPKHYADRREVASEMAFDDLYGQDLHQPTAFDLGGDF